MSENLKPAPQSEEVDLGQLFKMIGNAFQKLFDFIASIFKGLFYVLMLLLAHLFKNLKWYAIAVFAGLAVGYFWEKSAEKLYGANMYIETNLGASYQVYENISNLNQLAATDQDSVQLAETLNIDASEASKLKGFYIEPVTDPNRSIQLFSDFYNELDSLTKTTTTYEDYVASLDIHSFKVHKIGVVSSDKTIFRNLKKNFSDAISKNEYLDSLLAVNQKNLERREKTLIAQEEALDSIIDTYLKIRIRESEKEPVPGSGTILLMGNTQENKLLVDEAPLLKEKLELNEQRRAVNEQRIRQKDVISVISNFPATGYDIKQWYDKKIVLVPLVFLTISMLLFGTISLNKFVKNYKFQNS